VKSKIVAPALLVLAVILGLGLAQADYNYVTLDYSATSSTAFGINDAGVIEGGGFELKWCNLYPVSSSGGLYTNARSINDAPPGSGTPIR